MSNTNHIDKLVQDNEHLNKICNNQDNSIKNLENDRLRLNVKIDELTNEIKSLVSNLNAREDNLAYTKSQLDDSNRNVNILQNTVKELEMQNGRGRNENSDLNQKLQIEIRQRMECQSQLERTNDTLNSRTDQLNRCAYDLENFNVKNERLMEDNSKLFAEIDRLKNHTMILTEQNQRVRLDFYFSLQMNLNTY